MASDMSEASRSLRGKAHRLIRMSKIAVSVVLVGRKVEGSKEFWGGSRRRRR
jgi:hypothetical protein